MSINTDPNSLEGILRKLAKEVEVAVHTMYRREAGAGTMQVRTERFVFEARDRIAAATGASGAPVPVAQRRFTPVVAASAVEGAGTSAEWTADEAAAVTKCILAWLPMGPPAAAAPDSRCIAPGRELIPLWREREAARQAVGRVGRG